MKICPLCNTNMIQKMRTYSLISGNVTGGTVYPGEGSVDIFVPSHVHLYWECPKCGYTLSHEDSEKQNFVFDFSTES